jgi:hypothetical protein
VVYISVVLIPVARQRRIAAEQAAARDRKPPDKNVLDLM